MVSLESRLEDRPKLWRVSHKRHQLSHAVFSTSGRYGASGTKMSWE